MLRRQFAQLAAMAIVALYLPLNLAPRYVLYGDGQHDDTEALQAWANGKRVYRPDGSEATRFLHGEHFLLSDTITFDFNSAPGAVTNCFFDLPQGDFPFKMKWDT